MFTNSKVKKSITVINGQAVGSGCVFSFVTLCNTSCTYLIPTSCDKLLRFDMNWNFIDSTTLPYCIFGLTVVKSGNDFVYYGSTFGVVKLDKNFNELSYYFQSTFAFADPYFNVSNNRLYCTIKEVFNGLYVFDQDLTFIKQLRIGDDALMTVVEFNNKLYAGSTTGKIWVLENEIIVNSFQTLVDRPIHKLGFDTLGQFTFTNYDQDMFVYNYNGNYLSITLKSPAYGSFGGMDLSGNLIFFCNNGIFIYGIKENSTSVKTKIITNNCNMKS